MDPRVFLILNQVAHALSDASRNFRAALLVPGGRELLFRELDERISNIREIAQVLEDLKQHLEKEGME